MASDGHNPSRFVARTASGAYEMGHFYTNVTLKGPSQLEIAAAIHHMRRWALVSPTYDSLTVAFDRESELQDGTGYRFVELLTRQLGCLGLYVTNHDDSVLYYHLFSSGLVIDNYCPSPNYFEGDPAPPEGGDAEILCRAFGIPSVRDHLDEVLCYNTFANDESNRYVFEIDRHRDIVESLRLPSVAVGFGYTYLANGEFPNGILPDDDLVVVEGDPDD